MGQSDNNQTKEQKTAQGNKWAIKCLDGNITFDFTLNMYGENLSCRLEAK